MSTLKETFILCRIMTKILNLYASQQNKLRIRNLGDVPIIDYIAQRMLCVKNLYGEETIVEKTIMTCIIQRMLYVKNLMVRRPSLKKDNYLYHTKDAMCEELI